LNLTNEERDCLEGKDAIQKDTRSVMGDIHFTILPQPIDHTSIYRCDLEREDIFAIMHRKRVLMELQRKVETLEKRRIRGPDRMELSREAIVAMDKKRKILEAKVRREMKAMNEGYGSYSGREETKGAPGEEPKIDIFGDIAGKHERDFLKDFPARGNEIYQEKLPL
jgi:hypothetical protein